MKKNNNNPDNHQRYLSARQEWNECFGDFIASRNRWRWVAISALLLSCFCVGGLIWFAGQPRLLPYLIEVNDRGQPLGYVAARRLPDTDAERNVMRYQLARFVQGVFSVSPDVMVQRQAIAHVYALLRSGQPAYQSVSEWFSQNHPLKRAKEETAVVVIDQILPISDQTWRVEWTETRRGRNGERLSRTEMTGTLTIQIGGEVSEKNLLLNPTGLYVSHFDWQKQLGNN